MGPENQPEPVWVTCANCRKQHDPGRKCPLFSALERELHRYSHDRDHWRVERSHLKASVRRLTRELAEARGQEKPQRKEIEEMRHSVVEDLIARVKRRQKGQGERYMSSITPTELRDGGSDAHH